MVKNINASQFTINCAAMRDVQTHHTSQLSGDGVADDSESVTAYTESIMKEGVVSESHTKEGVVSEGATFHGLSATDKCESVVDSGLDSMLVSSMNES